MRYGLTLLLFLLLSACQPAVPPPVAPPPEVKAPPAPALVPAAWSELPGWTADDPLPALSAFRAGCTSLRNREGWALVCAELEQLPLEATAVRAFFESRFRPFTVQQEDGGTEGLITGYYGPELRGSRKSSKKYRHAIYAWPEDMLVVDLTSIYPELGQYRLRGRVEGRRLVPYWSRAEIDARPELLQGRELFYVEDPVDLFFLHIQGSGRIQLPDGSRVMVGYENQNGHPFRSIGKVLLDRGVMTRDQMSMQNIRAWARKNPDQMGKLLAENPSYVFFRELDPTLQTPPGAMGLPLMPERSLAVDPRTIPLGAPVYLATVRPDDGAPLERLMVAQDTGGAIKGRVRADFFWGMGDTAGALAGRMKQQGRLWLLLPLELAEVAAAEKAGAKP